MGGLLHLPVRDLHHAAGIFAGDILAGRPGARDRYLGLLRAGGSNAAYRSIRNAGVDLARPEPYRNVVTMFAAIVDEATRLFAWKIGSQPG